jgi:hypothetical protein
LSLGYLNLLGFDWMWDMPKVKDRGFVCFQEGQDFQELAAFSQKRSFVLVEPHRE